MQPTAGVLVSVFLGVTERLVVSPGTGVSVNNLSVAIPRPFALRRCGMMPEVGDRRGPTTVPTS